MGRRRWPSVVLPVLAFSASLFAGSGAARAEATPVGPPIGNNAYQAALSAAGDVDDYTGTFLAGETVTFTVTALKVGKTPATLRPLLVLVDPDGVERTAGSVTTPTLLSMTYKSYLIDKTGQWTARVSAKDGTLGPYVASFSVRAARKQTLKGEVLGGSAGLARGYPFPGIEGATFSAAAVWKKGKTPVSFVGLHRPDGNEVQAPGGTDAVLRATTKGAKTQIKGVVLDGGSGAYELRTFIPMGESVFTLTLDVRPPKRKTGKKPAKLGDVEPVLDALAVPKAGEPGDTVRFTGTGFATGATPPVVRFGSAICPSVTVTPDGTAVDCVVPERAGPAFVAVYLVNPDGQGTVQDDLFAYQPPPIVTDLVDNATGSAVRASPTAGGRVVRVVGDNFELGYVVKVGGTQIAAVTRLSETEFRFTLPAMPAGLHRVSVTDPFLREAASPFEVKYKAPPTFAAAPYSPAALRLNQGTTLTITGTGFVATDQVRFGGADMSSTFVSGTTRTVPLSPLTAGTYTVEIIDEIGTVVGGPVLYAKGPGVVSTVTVPAGAVINSTEIPLVGGSTIRVDGSSFAPGDTVTLGGTAIPTLATNTATRKEFTAPAGFQGWVQIVITDGAGQATTVNNAVRYVGFADDTSSRHPSVDGTDDFRALRGAVADLDGDGAVDDVVLVSPDGSTVGSRSERTRVLFGDGEGALADATADSIPAAGSDPYGIETWDAQCVAIGDLDADGSLDIVLGGEVVSGAGYAQVRILENDGSGVFTHDAYYGPGVRYESPTYAFYRAAYPYYGYRQTRNPLYGATQQAGIPTALAIGDIDADGDMDLVVGTDHFEQRSVYYDPAKAQYQYISSYYYYYGFYGWVVSTQDTANYQQYVPALRIYDAQEGEVGLAMVDVSKDRLNTAGTSSSALSQPPALHARDLALGDVDGDGMLDLVVAWDDPSTVTAYGLSTLEANGQSSTGAAIATRVLLNDGSGGFTNDATATWMPSPSTPEYWHADRVLLADLDADSDLDLVLLLAEGVDDWRGNGTRGRRALRVLRNTGTRFTDATSGLPALVTGDVDDFRGDALSVRDVNGDGQVDILVSTTGSVINSSGQRLPSVRVFFGAGTMTWTLGRPFLVGVGTDSGEASDLLWSDDLDPNGDPVLIYVNERAPAVSPSSRKLRTEIWTK